MCVQFSKNLSVVADPARSPDPVDVLLDLGGHVEVHHIGNLVEWCLSMVYQLSYQYKTNCGIKKIMYHFL